MKINKALIITICLLLPFAVAAQPVIAVAADYEELTDTKPHDGPEVWQKMKTPVGLEWGSVDMRYPKQNVPQLQGGKVMQLSAWKGERVHAQAVLYTNKNLDNVSVAVGSLTQGGHTIPARAVTTHFVRYVMTDGPNRDGSGCGHRENKAEWDSLLVADVLDIIPARNVKACTVQPIWVKVNVPADAHPGKYEGMLTVTAGNMQPMKLKLVVKVNNRTLPPPSRWALHLDFWQNPYAVARYYNVPLWSEAHFNKLRPIMKMLANVGQRSITTTIMHKPWNGQTQDHFDSMVSRTKHIDGSWSYDYTVFDKWVNFMMNDVGIKSQISCYTMIPWNLRFDYYDQATATVKFLEAKPGDEAYAEYWGTFLKDFARHLKEKGWFEKTVISMDERPLEAMRQAIKVVKAADPKFKISLAGDYHSEIQQDLYYLSIPYGKQFPEEVLHQRRQRGQISTVYTCCTECFPNIFTFSPPAEATWTAVHALAGGYDGYLRWSVNAWTIDPLRDSRFRLFAAGDTYSIYPGPRSSIRFERMMEGLQCCEKIYLLRKDFIAKGEKGKLKKLNKVVARFTPSAHEQSRNTAAQDVATLHQVLNSL